MKLKIFTANDVRDLFPCYDPVTGIDEDGDMVHPGGFIPEGWVGTMLDILKIDACPVEDRLWLVCRKGCIDDRTLRLFAVRCARQALRLVDNPDPRSVVACDVAERYALGSATSQELAAAMTAAVEAAWNFAMGAAKAAAWAAVWVTAEAATRAADWTSRIAAEVAAWSAAGDADWAAWAAAWAAARESQIKHLIAMLEADDRKS